MLTDIRTAPLRTGVLVGEYEVFLAGGDVRNELRSGYESLDQFTHTQPLRNLHISVDH